MGSIKNQEEWAIFLAAICGQTYAQFTNPDGSFIVPLDYKTVDTIDAKSISKEWERFGFILESPQEIIIAFRGTSTTTNWISNILASQKRFKYVKESCLTHRGFTDIYASARSGILSALSRLSPDKTLYVTGHSLGGALASLCAIDVAANTPFITPHLFTYGSPRVGDPDFTRVFKKYILNSCRIANLFDVVTYAPPVIYKLPRRDKSYPGGTKATITVMSRPSHRYLFRMGQRAEIISSAAISQNSPNSNRNSPHNYAQRTKDSVPNNKSRILSSALRFKPR